MFLAEEWRRTAWSGRPVLFGESSEMLWTIIIIIIIIMVVVVMMMMIGGNGICSSKDSGGLA